MAEGYSGLGGDFDPSTGPGGLEPLPDEADKDNEPVDAVGMYLGVPDLMKRLWG